MVEIDYIFFGSSEGFIDFAVDSGSKQWKLSSVFTLKNPFRMWAFVHWMVTCPYVTWPKRVAGNKNAWN